MSLPSPLSSLPLFASPVMGLRDYGQTAMVVFWIGGPRSSPAEEFL